jgi:hypothetical protein
VPTKSSALRSSKSSRPSPRGSHSTARVGFAVLLCVGILDSAVMMGFMTPQPLLLKEKGASLQTVGLALALIIVGGAASHLRVGTAALILAVLVSPVTACLALLPLLGIMLSPVRLQRRAGGGWQQPLLPRPDSPTCSVAYHSAGCWPSGRLPSRTTSLNQDRSL